MQTPAVGAIPRCNWSCCARIYTGCCDCAQIGATRLVAAPKAKINLVARQTRALLEPSVSAVDCCERSFGTRTATTTLACVRLEAGAQDKAHRGSTEFCTARREDWQFSPIRVAASAQRFQTTALRAAELRRNSHRITVLSAPPIHRSPAARPHARSRTQR